VSTDEDLQPRKARRNTEESRAHTTVMRIFAGEGARATASLAAGVGELDYCAVVVEGGASAEIGYSSEDVVH